MTRTMLLAVAAAAALALPAQAAQIKLMASGAMSHALQEIGDDFAKKNGHTIEYTVSTTGVLQDKLRGGEKADIIESHLKAWMRWRKRNWSIPQAASKSPRRSSASQ